MEKTWAEVGIHDRDITNGRRGDIKARCPRCSTGKNDKSLSVNTIKKTWQCWRGSCRWTGSLFESTHYISPAADSYTMKKLTKISQRGIEWLLERKISMAVINKYDLRSRIWVDKDFNKAETIAFPMIRDGQLINLAYRRIWHDPPLPPESERKGRYFFHGQAELCLMNTDCITSSTKTLYWNEGWPDGLAIETVSFDTPWVSIPNGSPKLKDDGTLPNVDGRLQCIDRMIDKLSKVDRHILLLDNDEAGQVMTKVLSRRLNASKCHLPQWPASNGVKIKDPGDVLLHLGSESLIELTENYLPYPLEGIATKSDIKFALSGTKHLKCDAYCGLPSVDRIFGLVLGYTHVITGPPGMGKSTLMSDIIRRVVMQYGWKAGILSAEDTLRDYVRRVTMQASGVPRYKFTDQEVEEWSDWFFDHYSWIIPEEVNTIDNLLEIGAQLVEQKGIRVLLADPYAKFESERKETGMGEVDYLRFSINKFNRFARRYQVAVIIVAHPPTLKEKDGSIRQVSSLYEISGGAMWGNLADTINAVQPIVSKNFQPRGEFFPARFETFKCRQRPELGDVGYTYLWFNRNNKRFIETSDLDEEIRHEGAEI